MERAGAEGVRQFPAEMSKFLRIMTYGGNRKA